MTAIATNGLTKEYGSVTALDGLDLTVEEGEAFGFLGPNGAGKTTTIDLLLDYIRPTDGHATICGYDTMGEPDEVRARVGVLPDGFDLWDRSTARRHLAFAIDATDGDGDPVALLERVGLDPEVLGQRVGTFSKGMRQRLGLAMALAGDPEVLILDEPATGLDPHGIRRMREIVREEVEAGTTVFFSSHVLGQVSAVCDRVGILDAGELVAIDTIEGLREAAGVGHELVLEVDDSSVEPIADIDGVVDVAARNGALHVGIADPSAKSLAVHRLVEHGVTVHDLAVEETSLEDLFAAYTNGGETA